MLVGEGPALGLRRKKEQVQTACKDSPPWAKTAQSLCWAATEVDQARGQTRSHLQRGRTGEGRWRRAQDESPSAGTSRYADRAKALLRCQLSLFVRPPLGLTHSFLVHAVASEEEIYTMEHVNLLGCYNAPW